MCYTGVGGSPSGDVVLVSYSGVAGGGGGGGQGGGGGGGGGGGICPQAQGFRGAKIDNLHRLLSR